jgi:hypothetical protein
MAAERSLHLQPVDGLGAGPAFGRSQDHHRPLGAVAVGSRPRGCLNLGDPVEGEVESDRHALVDFHRILAVETAFDDERVIAVTGEQRHQLIGRNPGQYRWCRDLVPVQMQDRQHRSVVDRVQELVGVPAGGRRAGLGFPVAHDARHDEVGTVEGRPEGVGERVAELTPLVDGPRGLGRAVARDAPREGELSKEPVHAHGVPRDVRIELGVGALEPRVGHDGGTAVPGTTHEQRLDVAFGDHSGQVGMDEVETWTRAPVAEESGLDVLRPERLAEQGIVEQIDLTGREIVGRPPVGVEPGQFEVPSPGWAETREWWREW